MNRLLPTAIDSQLPELPHRGPLAQWTRRTGLAALLAVLAGLPVSCADAGDASPEVAAGLVLVAGGTPADPTVEGSVARPNFHDFGEVLQGTAIEHAFELRKVVKESDRVFCVGTQKMALSKFRDARKLIAEGEIGKPVWSQTSYCRNSTTGEWNYYGIDPNWKPGENLDWDEWLGWMGPREWDPKVYARWRRYKDFSTGIVGDLLVHQMTPLIYSLDLGFPIRVTGAGGHYIDKDMENHDQVFLTVEFEGDHTMVVAGSTINDRGLEVMIRGHRGDLLLGGRNVELVPQAPYVDDVDPRTITTQGGNTHDALRRDWLNSVRTREQNRSTTAFALKHMVVVELGTRSLWERQAFSYDPTESVVGVL